MDSIPITFSQPVTGLTLSSLQLTLNGANVPLTGVATLTGIGTPIVDAQGNSYYQNWTLGNLAGLTSVGGKYQLTLEAAGSGIADASGEPLAASASQTWVMSTDTLQGTALGNDVIRIAADAADPTMADVSISNSLSTTSYTLPLAQVSEWLITATPGDPVILDFSNGNPFPLYGGVFYNGVASTNNDTLSITGTSANDNVTLTPSEITVNGGPAITYSNVPYFQFIGQGSLTVDGATLADVPNAISSGTAVTVTGGGIIDAGGTTATISSVTLAGGSLANGTFLSNNPYLVQSGTVSASFAGSASLIKNSGGTVVLSAANQYSGGTAIDAGTLLVDNTAGSGTGSGPVAVNTGGTLGGVGTISGPTTIVSGSILAPGDGGIGALTIDNTLSLDNTATAAMEINASAATSDLVEGVTTMTYAGTLSVTNLAGTFAAGDTFTLFYAGSYAGSFTTINLPALPDGLGWNTAGLAVNGSITIVINPPTVATAATATPSTVLGTTANLSVLGADPDGESNLSYTWATTGTPPAAVAFSINGTNAAKQTTVTFAAAGSYSFQVTINDLGGLSTISTVNVVVDQTLTSILVSPANTNVDAGSTQQFAATAFDQFGARWPPNPHSVGRQPAGRSTTAVFFRRRSSRPARL